MPWDEYFIADIWFLWHIFIRFHSFSLAHFLLFQVVLDAFESLSLPIQFSIGGLDFVEEVLNDLDLFQPCSCIYKNVHISKQFHSFFCIPPSRLVCLFPIRQMPLSRISLICRSNSFSFLLVCFGSSWIRFWHSGSLCDDSSFATSMYVPERIWIWWHQPTILWWTLLLASVFYLETCSNVLFLWMDFGYVSQCWQAITLNDGTSESVSLSLGVSRCDSMYLLTVEDGLFPCFLFSSLCSSFVLSRNAPRMCHIVILYFLSYRTNDACSPSVLLLQRNEAIERNLFFLPFVFRIFFGVSNELVNETCSRFRISSLLFRIPFIIHIRLPEDHPT